MSNKFIKTTPSYIHVYYYNIYLRLKIIRPNETKIFEGSLNAQTERWQNMMRTFQGVDEPGGFSLNFPGSNLCTKSFHVTCQLCPDKRENFEPIKCNGIFIKNLRFLFIFFSLFPVILFLIKKKYIKFIIFHPLNCKVKGSKSI